jgi:hypothetical protein
MYLYTGIIGLLVFIADIWAIVTILKTPMENGAKLLWCLLIIILPVFGLIIWYVAGPKR